MKKSRESGRMTKSSIVWGGVENVSDKKNKEKPENQEE